MLPAHTDSKCKSNTVRVYNENLLRTLFVFDDFQIT